MRRLSLAVLGMLLFVGASYTVQGQQPSAETIMERMASAYASCNSYVDEGEVRSVFLEPGGPRTQIKPFSTAFVRRLAFRFEYKSRRAGYERAGYDIGGPEWDRYIIWRGTETVKSWWSITPGVKNQPDLFHALGEAAGVSNLSSVTVPSLLMPELAHGSRIKSLSKLRLIGEEEVKGSKAYKIEGVDLRGNTVTVWVDAASMLLLKVYEKKKFDKFEVEATTTYKPQVNVEVARKKLEFNLPGGGS